MAEEFHAGICGKTWWNWNQPKTMFTACNSSLYSGHDSVSIDSTLQMMGFGLPSTTSDWNQTLLEDSFKPVLNQEFSMGSTTSYECPSTLLQRFLEADHNEHPQQVPQEESFFNNYMTSSATYGAAPSVRPPLTKQQPEFNNNASFWNASATSVNDVKSGFLLSPFEEKPNCPGLTTKTNIGKVRKSESVMNKACNEAPLKRARIETPSPLPTFKVRKEKLGDRITALQQLVSPFGKTDTASVLHEAIEYIKFLHDQVNVLSTPYMKQAAASIQQQLQQQITDKLKDQESPKQDLRSRGLCLVPVSSTFPVANETPADFWTPTFGGTFR